MDQQNNFDQPIQPMQQPQQPMQQPQQPAQPATKMISRLAPKMNLITSIGGMVSGLLSIIFGIIVLGMSIGNHELYREYGGDAYTGIQQAAAQTANNVVDLADLIRSGFGFVLIVAGLIAIFAFAR